MKKIVVFGPGPQFKGGIANYNTSLAKALDRREDMEVHIVSWTQQYPAIIPRDFIDRKSKADQLEGTGIQVHYLLNYNKPGTWKKNSKADPGPGARTGDFPMGHCHSGNPSSLCGQEITESRNQALF